MNIVLAIFAIVVSLALCLSVYLNIRLGKTILAAEDQVEESLDILDESYQQISVVVSIPVLSDEPVIRNVLTSIKNSRDALLLIANKLVVFGQSTDSTQEPDDDNDDTN